MARKISIKQAINEAIDQEMSRDPSVIMLGEDIVGGAGGEGEMDAWGGVLGVTKGLIGEFGEARVIDTPITESAIMGAAAGAAATGLRPIVELMFVDFMGVCFDQIFNQAAKFRYMFGGKAVTPMVVRTTTGVTALPPNMYRNLAAWLKIWSKQTPMKSMNMSSATGRMPLDDRFQGVWVLLAPGGPRCQR